jgi:hypothetical protein
MIHYRMDCNHLARNRTIDQQILCYRTDRQDLHQAGKSQRTCHYVRGYPFRPEPLCISIKVNFLSENFEFANVSEFASSDCGL